MSRYVAFLRAINVGGHIAKMHDLRRLFEGMGFSNVETYIQSGKVVFGSSVRKVRGLRWADRKDTQMQATVRNSNTVRKMAEKYGSLNPNDR